MRSRRYTFSEVSDGDGGGESTSRWWSGGDKWEKKREISRGKEKKRRVCALKEG